MVTLYLIIDLNDIDGICIVQIQYTVQFFKVSCIKEHSVLCVGFEISLQIEYSTNLDTEFFKIKNCICVWFVI